VKAAAHASRPRPFGNWGTSPHRSEGPPPISWRPIADFVAPTVRGVLTYPMRLRDTHASDARPSSRRATCQASLEVRSSAPLQAVGPFVNDIEEMRHYEVQIAAT